MLNVRVLRKLGATILFLLVSSTLCLAQVADGNLTGAVLDPHNAAIVGATVRAENAATGQISTAKTDSIGNYRFANLLVGDYTLTVSATGFQTMTVTSVNVELSKINTQSVGMQVGSLNQSISVTASSLLDTITGQIANISTRRMSSDLAFASNTNGGFLNLSLLGAGVVSSGGLGAGTGPSVGGQRPRNNNYTIEGTDNNRKDVTGPVASLPNDAVEEFTLLQNQFSAEYGHSSGGQFNVVLRSGTNQVHGEVYEYFQNRYLNAMDAVYKRQGLTDRLRYDQNLLGGSIGGPIKKDKLFYFGGFDYNPTGSTNSSSSQSYAPTADGYATLQANPSLSPTNLAVLKQYAGVAPVTDGYSVSVLGSSIPAGPLTTVAPFYSNRYRSLASLEYNQSDNDQWRLRVVQNNTIATDTGAALPAFWNLRPTTAYLGSASEFHTFSPTMLNEARFAFNRFSDRRLPPSNVTFPGLDAFPTIVINDLGMSLGPLDVSPQVTDQNVFQLADNFSWTWGRHDFKFGFDGRDSTSSLNFISKARGEYHYNTLSRYLLDQSPDGGSSSRTVGGQPYRGNNIATYLFANDNWRVTHHLTINLGVRWEYNGIPKSAKEQALNSIADVPGVITFAAPKAQLANFAPRVGFAYSPGNHGGTVIRGGFGLAYDQIFDNIYSNTRPPQTGGVPISVTSSSNPNLLGTGGIPNTVTPVVSDPDWARFYTTGYIPNQQLGYAINWNLGVERAIGKDWVVDVRYLGSRGVHLLLQTQVNRIAIVTPTNSLPTYLVAPSQSELDALPLTLTQLNAQKGLSNTLAQYGFQNSLNITAYEPLGASIYNGLAIDVNKRFARQFLFKGAYTWSHTEDNSTAEINTTSLTPRRPQDFGNLQPEWGTSLLDRRHRMSLTWVWDTPWMQHSSNPWMRNVLGNYSFSGVYAVESPEYVTPQSGIDANLNGDSATDRVIVNPNGTPGVGSDVTSLKNTAGQVVAYAAKNPNAMYLIAQTGAYANGGRNILATNRINNFDLSVSKSITWREHYRAEFRADFYNAFNHSQYVPGRVDSVGATPYTTSLLQLRPNQPTFGKWDQIFPNNARNIQLVGKFSF